MVTRFFELEDFPALESLTKNWKTIRDEARRLGAPVLGINRVGKSHTEVQDELEENGQGNGWIKGWSIDDEPNEEWLSYGLVMFDQSGFDVERRMPKTMALLRELEGIKVGALNKLRPHTLLSTHRHPELRAEGLLQYHLCLEGDAPLGLNYLNVDGEFKQQTPGLGYVFDGSLPHFAVNATDQDRIILYMEFHVQTLRGLAPVAQEDMVRDMA